MTTRFGQRTSRVTATQKSEVDTWVTKADLCLAHPVLQHTTAMTVARLSALIPPKIASPSAIGQAQTAARMTRVVDFYSKLPKGPAPKKSPGLNPWARYKAKYFHGETASGAPIVHVMIAFFFLGYTLDYNAHLKHHKNNHH